MADKIIIPTKTSQLLNDSGYLTKAEIELLLEEFAAELNGVTIQITYSTLATDALKQSNYVTIDGVEYHEEQTLRVPKGTSIAVKVSSLDIVYDGNSMEKYSHTFIADVSHIIEFRGMQDYQGGVTITPSVNLQAE